MPFFLTLWLSGQVRARGRIGRILRWSYLLTTFVLLAILALFPFQLFVGADIFGQGLIGWYAFVSSFLAGALWLPVQAFFASGFVALLIGKPAAPA